MINEKSIVFMKPYKAEYIVDLALSFTRSSSKSMKIKTAGDLLTAIVMHVSGQANRRHAKCR